MEKVHVDLKEKSYDILIENGLLKTVAPRITALLPQVSKAAIVTDSNVGPLYAGILEMELKKAGIEAFIIPFEAGEKSKDLATLGEIYKGLAQNGLTRSDAVIALGGGVTGDMAGLAAATFLRGIAFIQIPTSLLAAVDSSVGGKVAVDLPEGKNLVGAFYQPKAVYIDPDLLETLPERFLTDGMAEVIKYGCIKSPGLFKKLEGIKDKTDLLAEISGIIEECCSIKARIVEEDEFDNGGRMVLNFGHTLGHAVEKTFGYEKFTHGEGVAAGMALITQRSEALGLTEKGTAKRIIKILEQYGLPVTADVSRGDFLSAIALDKKKRGKKITLILIQKIGESLLYPVDIEGLGEFLP